MPAGIWLILSGRLSPARVTTRGRTASRQDTRVEFARVAGISGGSSYGTSLEITRCGPPDVNGVRTTDRQALASPHPVRSRSTFGRSFLGSSGTPTPRLARALVGARGPTSLAARSLYEHLDKHYIAPTRTASRRGPLHPACCRRPDAARVLRPSSAFYNKHFRVFYPSTSGFLTTQHFRVLDAREGFDHPALQGF